VARRQADFGIALSHPSVVSLKFIEKQPQILRLTTPELHSKEQRPLFGNPGTERRSGPRSLRMTANLCCVLQARDPSRKNKNTEGWGTGDWIELSRERARASNGVEKLRKSSLNRPFWKRQISSGAKARVDFSTFTARLKSCPDTGTFWTEFFSKL